MIKWITNWVNWVKLAVGVALVSLNYSLGWGWDSEAIATLGGLLVVPIEIWDIIVGLIKKVFKK